MQAEDKKAVDQEAMEPRKTGMQSVIAYYERFGDRLREYDKEAALRAYMHAADATLMQSQDIAGYKRIVSKIRALEV